MPMTKKPDRPSMNPALRGFWAKPSRFKILYGGRGSSKSWDAAAHAIRISRTVTVRFLATRMFQNRIEESVYNLLKMQAERFGVAHEFTFLKNKIIHNTTGSEFMFYGLARNIDEVKSLEGIDILWIEEAHNLTQAMWDVLEPTIRKEGSEIWIIFNPKFATDFVYREFVTSPPAGAQVRKINYPENPFLSRTMVETIERAKEKDQEHYEHIYLGEPLPDDDRVIIKRTWALAAIDAHKKIKGMFDGVKRVGYDVADDGDDLNAVTAAEGSVIVHTDEWRGGEDRLMESTSRAWNECRTRGADLIYDSIGVGAGVGSKCNELNASNSGKRVSHSGFNAGGKVMQPDAYYDKVAKIKNKDHFSNIKAQTWWSVADRFRNTFEAINKGTKFAPDELISISSDCPNIDKLIDELTTPRRHFDANGRVKVESKEDLRKRDVKSPNIADSCVMVYAPVKNSYDLTKMMRG